MIGRTIGAYHVVEKLGAGGMGEVYQARDTKLERDVALKLLHPAFAADPDRLMRFEREARTLASLNHPNIAAVYAIEGVPSPEGSAETEPPGQALVLELVDGEDLSARFAAGPVSVEDALPIARQIAEALEAAHEAGIIHRDLKPANIKLRSDGTVKVLDFGLAKAFDSTATRGSGTSGGADDPTRGRAAPASAMTSPAMTSLGTILGTAAYMSPEQAKGRQVDRRADVWAFGCVLFEMLSGQALFAREDMSETLAAVLTHEPDLDLLPESTPASIHRVLARCLAKDPRRRLDSMAAVRLDLEEAAAPDPSPGPAVRAVPRPAVAALVLAGILGGWALALMWPGTGSRGEELSPLRAQIPAPPGVIAAFHDGFALSPDGRTLAFSARDTSGLLQIWTRPLAGSEARPVRGTEEGRFPFWSPDGNHLGFFVGGILRRVPTAGGPTQTIADETGFGSTGSWSAGNEILFGRTGSIARVPASGGTAVEIPIDPPGARPQWLPDGRRFLYASIDRDRLGVYAASTEGGPSRLVAALVDNEGDSGIDYLYSSGGYLLTNRGDALTAQRFDPGTAELHGPVVALAGRVGTPKGWFAAAATGEHLAALVARSADDPGDPGDPLARLRWVDRSGEPMGDLGEPGRYWSVRLAPDGERAVVSLGDEIFEVRRDRRTRLDPEATGGAIWSPDGLEVVFRARPYVYRAGLGVEGDASRLPGVGGWPSDWSPDGRWLLIDRGPTPQAPSADIVLYDLTEATSSSWAATAFHESQGRFSPDGRFVAFISDAGGQDEVYVRAVSGAGSGVQASAAGGIHPIWRRDGEELFYLGPNDELMAVDVLANDDVVEIGEPRQLFRIPLNDITSSFTAPYDVAPDGERFLLNVPDAPAPLLLIRGIGALIDQ